MSQQRRTNVTALVTLAALVALVALGLSPGVPAAQSLRGVIVDHDTGVPVPGARVFLVHHRGDEVMYGVRADEEGRFDAADAIREGEFKVGERVVLSITARGYKLYEEHITMPGSAVEDEYRLRSLSSPDAATTAPRQVWIEVLLIKASGAGTTPPRYPKEIESVVENLSPLFKFSDYWIVGRAVAMGMEGSMLVFESGRNDESDSAFEVVAEIGFGNGFVKLPKFAVHVQRPMQKHISTALNLPEGEMVILGASRGEVTEGSLITVVSASYSPPSAAPRERSR